MAPVAMVTGGSRGIGRGITERLLKDGYRVSILATRPAPREILDELEALGEVAYTAGSIADPADHERYLAATLEAFGRVDVLVNNAGVAPSVRNDLLVATTDEFDRVLSINLRGPYFLTQLVANQMVAQAAAAPDAQVNGAIINVSSVSANTVSTNRGEYCISKAGVAMATQLWAARLAPEGILVYEVRPGVIATDMTAGVQEKYDALFANGLAPMPRWGQPSDVAGAVAVLASGQMPYSTGDVITVGGGMQIPRL
ncbi:MAG TPA: 3-ketoacyl-ACP reductase [Propionibacteriaceae bacterium]|nr:3-ketoacyl-ACP reductase [Propionibacteriaceae bacterium]